MSHFESKLPKGKFSKPYGEDAGDIREKPPIRKCKIGVIRWE